MSGESRKMRKNCSSVSKLIDKYFDQEISQRDQEVVEKHLKECPVCLERLKFMGEVKVALQRPVMEATEKETFPWIWEKIEREIRFTPRWSLWGSITRGLGIPPLIRKKIWIPATAVAILFLLLFFPSLFKKKSSHFPLPVVEYVESKTNNVMIYELENTKVTVIWLFEESEIDSSTS